MEKFVSRSVPKVSAAAAEVLFGLRAGLRSIDQVLRKDISIFTAISKKQELTTPYTTRKTKTKNRNLRVRRFVCLHHKKRPYKATPYIENIRKMSTKNLKSKTSRKPLVFGVRTYTKYVDQSEICKNLLKTCLLVVALSWDICDLMDYITILHIFEMKPTGTSETLAQLRRGFSKRFLRGFRFLNVVLLKRARTSKRFLKGSRSPEVFQRFFRGF